MTTPHVLRLSHVYNEASGKIGMVPIGMSLGAISMFVPVPDKESATEYAGANCVVKLIDKHIIRVAETFEKVLSLVRTDVLCVHFAGAPHEPVGIPLTSLSCFFEPPHESAGQGKYDGVNCIVEVRGAEMFGARETFEEVSALLAGNNT